MKIILWSLLVAAQPNLPDVLRQAEAERPVIAAARLRFEEAKRQARSLGLPGQTRLETGLSSAPDLNGGEDLAVFQPIDVFGRAAAGRRLGRATVAQAEAAYRQARLDFQSDLLSALADWQAAKASQQDGTERVEVERAAYQSVQKRIAAGDLAPTQLLRADLDARRAQIEFERRTGALNAAATRLRARLGQAVPSAEWDFAGLPTDRAERPDLRASVAEVAIAQAEASVAAKDGLPTFELQGRRSPWTTQENKYDLRLQLVIPLWDHGSARLAASAASTRAKAAAAELRDRERLAAAAVESATLEMTVAQAAYEAYGPILADARENLAKVRRGFDLGANSLLEVIDAARELSDVQDGRAEARRAMWQAQIQWLTEKGILLAERA